MVTEEIVQERESEKPVEKTSLKTVKRKKSEEKVSPKTVNAVKREKTEKKEKNPETAVPRRRASTPRKTSKKAGAENLEKSGGENK